MSEPVSFDGPRIESDVFAKARDHDRREILELAEKADMMPYFRLLTSQAGPVVRDGGPRDGDARAPTTTSG